MNPPIMPQCGIGLRAPHVAELLNSKPMTGFLEIHSENYFGGGLAKKQLLALREKYEFSCHGVGLSLGRFDELDVEHLKRLKSLYDAINPTLVSEHLSFSTDGNAHTPDLLPLPLTREAMKAMVRNVEHAQEFTGRRYLIENPSNYISYADYDYSEPEFLNELCAVTGCGILLDVNNIAVSAHNLGLDAKDFIDEMNPNYVGEIHLAGYQINALKDGGTIHIDTHGKPVHEDVWALYDYAISKIGPRLTLIEWDSDIPNLETLIGEAKKADKFLSPQEKRIAQNA